MPRRLVAINVVLAAVSVLCVALIVKQLATVRPTPTPRNRPPVAAPAEAPPAGESRPAPQAYNVIATRNLFSPTRTESAGPALASNAPALVAKPNLHGVVLREGSPIAYLEDPLTKRISGYRIGDPIAGGTVQTISADAVVISRPDGMLDVRLRDPSKPRPAPPAPAGQPPAPGQLPNQGPFPPRGFTPSGTPMVPGQAVPPPAVIQPPMPGGPSSLPFTRPSPSLGRRLPPMPQGESGQPLPAPNQ
jgi:hypothetical protein